MQRKQYFNTIVCRILLQAAGIERNPGPNPTVGENEYKHASGAQKRRKAKMESLASIGKDPKQGKLSFTSPRPVSSRSTTPDLLRVDVPDDSATPPPTLLSPTSSCASTSLPPFSPPSQSIDNCQLGESCFSPGDYSAEGLLSTSCSTPLLPPPSRSGESSGVPEVGSNVAVDDSSVSLDVSSDRRMDGDDRDVL